MQLKQMVYHQIHGKGRIERLYNNATIALVDFNGTMKRCEVALLGTSKDTLTRSEILTLIKMVEGETCNGSTNHSEGGRIALNELKKRL